MIESRRYKNYWFKTTVTKQGGRIGKIKSSRIRKRADFDLSLLYCVNTVQYTYKPMITTSTTVQKTIRFQLRKRKTKFGAVNVKTPGAKHTRTLTPATPNRVYAGPS